MRIRRKYLSTIIIGLLILLATLRYMNQHRVGGQCAFDDRRDVSELVYSNHARCRMGCRDVPRNLVEKVYQKGEVNCKKSHEERGDMRYALEMKDSGGERIRVVIAVDDEEDKHVVVTVIRLDRDDRCECS